MWRKQRKLGPAGRGISILGHDEESRARPGSLLVVAAYGLYLERIVVEIGEESGIENIRGGTASLMTSKSHNFQC